VVSPCIPLSRVFMIAGSAIYQFVELFAEVAEVLHGRQWTQIWTLDDFVPSNERREIPELVSPEVTNRTKGFEEKRVNIRTRPDRLSLPQLGEFVLSKPSPLRASCRSFRRQ